MSEQKLMKMETGDLIPRRPRAQVAMQVPDEIPPKVVGSVNVRILINVALEEVRTGWFRVLLNCLNPADVEQWCGRMSEFSHNSPLVSRSDVFPVITKLAETILRPVRDSQGTQKLYTTIFLVPKDDETARVIGDCKEANKGFKPCPPLQFASVEDLFRIITYFPEGAFFATGDFRHWFYQLPLPKGTEKNFTVVGDDKQMYEFIVWPMGFAWSPFTAQALSMLLAKLAIQNAGYIVESPGDDVDVLPPFWVIKDKHNPERPIGFALFWYDNLLLVTQTAETREAILSDLEDLTSKVGALLETKGQESKPARRHRRKRRDVHQKQESGLLLRN
eukprot:GDKJ01005127.1.p1 GENE.GDKJ01005127.1~~GDKJ01005127.1.p1  ORF type:complete len:333 (-),score=-2.17 GDKJ01005127.1:340-1338(-)